MTKMKVALWICLSIIVVQLAACSTTGPVSGPVLAGLAAVVAVFDQLLASGVVTQFQHDTVVQGLNGMEAEIQNIMVATQATGKAVGEVKQGALTVETATIAGGAIITALLGGKPALKGVAAAVRALTKQKPA